jgi:hypothetical protein
MQATAAYMACCQKSSACHQATSSSRPGSVPAVDSRRSQDRVLRLGVLPAAEIALGQELLAQSL